MRAALFTLLVVTLAATPAAAQSAGEVDQSSFAHALATGSGARGWGMGGAQIGVPGDIEAATWNPASLAALSRPAGALSFSLDRVNGAVPPLSYANPSAQQSTRVDIGSITPTRARATGNGLDLAIFAWPFRLGGRNVVAGVSLERRLAYGLDVDAAYEFRHQSLYTFNYDYAMAGAQQGALRTVAVSLAMTAHPRLRVGGTVRRWFGDATLPARQTYTYSLANYYSWTGTYTETLDDTATLSMSGIGFDAGALVAVVKDRVTLGVVYRGGVSGSADYSNAPAFTSTNTQDSFSSQYAGSGTLTLPDSFGVGVAVTARRNLLITFDQVQTRWSKAQLTGYARATAQGATPLPATCGVPTFKPADSVPQSDTMRLALGLEYTLRLGSLSLPLRAGAFRQQAWLADETPPAWGATAGTRLRWRGAALDLAYLRMAAVDRYARHSVRVSLGYTF